MTAEGDRLARVRNYFFTPDVIAEVCRELNVPYHINGYRYWM
jgi:RNA polymerase sigma-70 factor (ECF subfamily)